LTIRELIDRLRSQGSHETYPVATADDIHTTESALGKSLPDSYKTFVREFSNGAYLFGVQEVGAVGAGNRQIMAIQKIERTGVDAAEIISIREGGSTTYGNLIPFGLDSNGNEWCFLAGGEPAGYEYPVAYYHSSGHKLFGYFFPSFSDWLQRLVETQDEVIRTLYGDDVLYGELQLG
jgi:SMI1 / KNR4 family (SUKH-1)